MLKVRTEQAPEPVSLVAYTPVVDEGTWIEATGTWQQHRLYGQQFSADNLTVSEPRSLEGIERYLASGRIRGIGSTYARRLTEAFGEEVLKVIEHEPERLLEVPGIGKERHKRITEAWAEYRAVHNIMIFLYGHGVGSARATRIYKKYGDQAIELISENPYRLIEDIHGIGFRSADLIARPLGVAPDAQVRILAGLDYIMMEAKGEGHCGLPRIDLVNRTAELLGIDGEAGDEVMSAKVVSAVDEKLRMAELKTGAVSGKECLFTSDFYYMEQKIAGRLKKMVPARVPWPDINADRALAWVKGRLGFDLAPSQAVAVRAVLKSRITVITGGPGVGKTTIMLAILRILMAKEMKVLLCAPTGRAAKRMQETTRQPAKTIHRLLEIEPATGRFTRDAGYPLKCDLVIVDESSMVDVNLMYALTQALPEQAALLIIGDIDQLPSVGPGQILADIIRSKAVPVVRLTEVFRQAAHSRIISNAHRINTGQTPDFEPAAESDFFFVEARTPEEAADKIHTMVTERIPRRFGFDAVRDIQVLSPMRRGLVGTQALNTLLQSTLNPPGKNCVERSGWSYVPGDKVMQIENDYEKEVYNGDVGQIKSIDLKQGKLSIDFDRRLVIYNFSELSALSPAYAITIHKSQGSEYPAVVIPIVKQHHIMLERNLLYTGVTRGKKLAVLVGHRQAVATAVQSARMRNRWTRLYDCLTA